MFTPSRLSLGIALPRLDIPGQLSATGARLRNAEMTEAAHATEFDGCDPASPAATHKADRAEKIIFSFDQFQIALPPNRIGIMLRGNWPLTRWAASHPKTVRCRRKRRPTPEGERKCPI